MVVNLKTVRQRRKKRMRSSGLTKYSNTKQWFLKHSDVHEMSVTMAVKYKSTIYNVIEYLCLSAAW